MSFKPPYTLRLQPKFEPAEKKEEKEKTSAEKFREKIMERIKREKQEAANKAALASAPEPTLVELVAAPEPVVEEPVLEPEPLPVVEEMTVEALPVEEVTVEVVETTSTDFPEWKTAMLKSELEAIAKSLGLTIEGEPVDGEKHTKAQIVEALQNAEATGA